MRSAALVAAVVVLGVGAFLLIQQGTRRQTLLTGGLLLIIGLPLLGLARRQLGRAFAITPQAKGLVTEGLYARIPHPMYAFLDLALLGAIIMARRQWLLVVWAGLVAVQASQARREARILEQAFGDAYRDYRRRTWW
jgi:protein-S-isoprenylcysteine O-methyltransferase Ste14